MLYFLITLHNYIIIIIIIIIIINAINYAPAICIV